MPTEPDRDTPAVAITGLVKRLARGVVAVDHLDLEVGVGQVLGLAGPNGSGKSVTLKAILGLVRPTQGEIRIFGERVGPGASVLGRVGALVDGPGFVPHLSGLDNLRLAQRMNGPPDPAGLDEALALAGLGDAIHRPYATYSHGMRYRLGFAQAVLGRPDLLILDEPTDGLDPAQVREVRRAIAAEAERGATIVLASHALDEVELVCTHAAVLHAGVLIAHASIDELTDATGALRLDVDDPVRGVAALAGRTGIADVQVDARSLVVIGPDLEPKPLLDHLARAGVGVTAIRRGRTLEEAYLALLSEPR